jgi:hypothetical protein
MNSAASTAARASETRPPCLLLSRLICASDSIRNLVAAYPTTLARASRYRLMAAFNSPPRMKMSETM